MEPSTDFILGAGVLAIGLSDLAMAVYFLRFRDTSKLSEEQAKASKLIGGMLSGLGLMFSALGCALLSGAATLQSLLSHLG